MSKAIKAKKATPKKGGTWSRIWKQIKFGLFCLINNDECLEGRKKPWYAAVTAGLLSCFLAVLPFITTGFTAKGGAFLNYPNYSFGEGLTSFVNDFSKKEGLDLKIENQELVATGDWSAEYLGSENIYDHSYYIVTNVLVDNVPVEKPSEKITDFSVYYSAEKDAKTLYNEVTGRADYVAHNTLFLTKKDFLAYKWNATANNGAGSRTGVSGNWTHKKLQGLTFKDLAKANAKGEAYEFTFDNNYGGYVKEVTAAFYDVFTYSNIPVRNAEAWKVVGIASAVAIGMTVIMGTIIFLVTRGKNSPFRHYTFWETQKAGYWAAFTPAVLAMVLSYVLPNFRYFYFLMLFSFRIMWMSMRSLRPQYDQGK